MRTLKRRERRAPSDYAHDADNAFSAFNAFNAFGAFGAFNAFGAFGAFNEFSAFSAFSAFNEINEISALQSRVVVVVIGREKGRGSGVEGWGAARSEVRRPAWAGAVL